MTVFLLQRIVNNTKPPLLPCNIRELYTVQQKNTKIKIIISYNSYDVECNFRVQNAL